MYINKNLRDEKGSMTVYATVLLFAYLIILGGIFMSLVSMKKIQLDTVVKVKEAYEINLDNIGQIYQDQYNKQ